jgi:hypothetical protein
LQAVAVALVAVALVVAVARAVALVVGGGGALYIILPVNIILKLMKHEKDLKVHAAQ